MPTGKAADVFNFLVKRQTNKGRSKLPIIIQGTIAGMAAVTGLAAMKKAVMGVTIARIAAQTIPQLKPAIIRQALIIAPVTKMTKNVPPPLKNWLTIQMASKRAV